MTAFVYRWTNKTNGMWYIGSHTAQHAHVDDGYICSSKIVKPLILQNPDNWTREILNTGTAEEMYAYETSLLRGNNAARNPMSYNRSNNDRRQYTGKKTSNLSNDDITKKFRGIFADEITKIERLRNGN